MSDMRHSAAMNSQNPPRDRRKALYVNGGHMMRFKDMSNEDSTPLLRVLFAHLATPRDSPAASPGIGSHRGQPMAGGTNDSFLPTAADFRTIQDGLQSTHSGRSVRRPVPASIARYCHRRTPAGLFADRDQHHAEMTFCRYSEGSKLARDANEETEPETSARFLLRICCKR
jgi:hypothetical protein